MIICGIKIKKCAMTYILTSFTNCPVSFVMLNPSLFLKRLNKSNMGSEKNKTSTTPNSTIKSIARAMLKTVLPKSPSLK